MDDKVGGIYLHASEDASGEPTFDVEDSEYSSTDHHQEISGSFPTLTQNDTSVEVGVASDLQIKDKAKVSSWKTNWNEFLNGNANGDIEDSNVATDLGTPKDSISDVASVVCTSSGPAHKSNGHLQKAEGTEPQGLPAAFLESDISSALEALDDSLTKMHVDKPVEDREDTGQEHDVEASDLELASSNSINHNSTLDITTEPKELVTGLVDVDANTAIKEKKLPEEDSSANSGKAPSQVEAIVMGDSHVPDQSVANAGCGELQTDEPQSQLSKSSESVCQPGSSITYENTPLKKPETTPTTHVSHPSNNVTPEQKLPPYRNNPSFDPTSKLSLKQRQKIHNIIDRLRVGAHADKTTVSSSQSNSPAVSVASSHQARTEVSCQSNTAASSTSAMASDLKSKTIMYRLRQDPSTQAIIKNVVTKQWNLSGDSVQHSQGTGRPSADSSGPLVNRIQADNSSRGSQFPQVMIQDVFSQSTGKRLTQRNQPMPQHYQGTGSPMGVNQQGLANSSLVAGPQIAVSRSGMSPLGQPETVPVTGSEETYNQHYMGQSVQMSNHQMQADGTLAHQHHPKANISHYDRSGQGMMRPYGQWTYNAMHNPISNLQHFVNQPNPSHRQQAGLPLKQSNQAVVDLSSVHYGSSSSPIALNTVSSDPADSDQSLPRLQPVNSGQSPTQMTGPTRTAGYPTMRYGPGYAPNSASSGPYARHLLQPRQQQMIRPNVGNPSVMNHVYQTGSVGVRGTNNSLIVTTATKGVHYALVNSNSDMVSPDRTAPVNYDRNRYQSQDNFKHVPNLQLPIPLPNFGGFMSTQGLEGSCYDSLSGYLVVPIKKLKDSSSQTDESCLDNDSRYHSVSGGPQKASIGVQAQSQTFLCASCLTEADYEETFHEKTVDRVELKCKVCNKQFPSVSKLQNHKNKAHNIRLPFRCGECAIRFEDHASVVRHLASHSDDTTCHTCGKAFQSKDMLERHEKLHKSPVNTCQFCSKQFKSTALMRKHIEDVHWIATDKREGTINIRNEMNNNIDPHVKERIGSEKNNEFISLSDKVASQEKTPNNRSRLPSQDTTSDFGDHYCHFCQAQFATDKYLLNHYLSYHRKGYGFQCPVCPRYIHLWSRLKKHIKDHGLSPGSNALQESNQGLERTSSDVNPKSTAPSIQNEVQSGTDLAEKSFFRKTNDGRWECLKCGENFYSEVRVKNHLGTVHEERLYHCAICKLLFPHSTHLYWHMRDHKRKGDISQIPAKFVSQDSAAPTGSVSLKCKHCPEEFFVEKHLNSHLGQKHGYKVFSCQICGDKFNHSNRLITHMKLHSQKQKAKLVNRRQMTRSSLFNALGGAMKSADLQDSMDDSDMIESDMEVTTGDDELEKRSDDTDKTGDSNTRRSAAAFQNGFVYLCGFCNEGFSEESEFRSHMLGHQRYKKSFNCQHCGQKFSSEAEATEHLETHGSAMDVGSIERPIITEICSETDDLEDDNDSEANHVWTSAFVQVDSVSEKDTHATTANLVYGTASGTRLQRALSEGDHEMVSCPICGRNFKTKPGRRMHMKTSHQIIGMRHYAKIKERIRNRTLSCPICEKVFKTQSGNRLHLQNTHKVSLQVTSGMLKDTEEGNPLSPTESRKSRAVNVDVVPTSPPGLQKLIITKAKGQNTLIVSPADEPKGLSDDNTNDHQVKSPTRLREADQLPLTGNDKVQDYQCPFCEQVSLSAKGIRSHVTRMHYMEPKINNNWSLCKVCQRHFFNHERLLAHNAAVHEHKEEFECPGCTSVYPRFSGIYTHIRRKHPGFKFKTKVVWQGCEHCGRMFYNKQALESHIQTAHPQSSSIGNRLVEPSPLSPKSPVMSGDEANWARGKVGAFHCPLCEKVVVTIKGMQVHILKRHPSIEIKKWQLWKGCTVCRELFYDDRRLNDHMKESHESGKMQAKVKVPIKKQLSLDESSSMVDETLESVIGGFQCPLCNEFYSKFMGVDAHLRQTHNVLDRKRRPDWSRCPLCHQYYYTKEALEGHLEERHNGDVVKDAGFDTTAHDADVSGEISFDASDGTEAVGFQCPKCEAVIPTIKGMQVHMFRGHSRLKRKPWQDWLPCTHCSLNFYDTDALSEHLARHNLKGNVDMSTNEVNRSVASSQDDTTVKEKETIITPLKNDMVLNSGYHCPVCPHVCPKYAGIDTHLRVKHNYKAIHGKKYWLLCDICGLHFYDKGKLSNHVSSIHSGDMDANESNLVSEDVFDSNVTDVVRPLREISTSTPKAPLADEEGEGYLSAETPRTDDEIRPSKVPKYLTAPKSPCVGYECPYCYRLYPKFLGADAHIRQRHGSRKRKPLPGWILCNECGRLICDQEHYDEHMKKHAEGTAGVSEKFETSQNHGNDFHGITHTTDGGLPGEADGVDMNLVRRGTFHCPCCDLVTNYKGIGVHLAKRHKSSPRKRSQLWAPCPQCNYFFYDETLMKGHIDSHHQGEHVSPASVSAAGGSSRSKHNDQSQGVTDKGNSVRGTGIIGTGTYYCPGCNRVSTLCRGISAHIWHQHKQFSTQAASAWKQCGTCLAFFYSDSYLAKHKKEVHGKDELEICETLEEVDTEKRAQGGDVLEKVDVDYPKDNAKLILDSDTCPQETTVANPGSSEERGGETPIEAICEAKIAEATSVPISCSKAITNTAENISEPNSDPTKDPKSTTVSETQDTQKLEPGSTDVITLPDVPSCADNMQNREERIVTGKRKAMDEEGFEDRLQKVPKVHGSTEIENPE